MDLVQYKLLQQTPAKPPVVGVEQLVDRTPRTLLYGYTAERHTWHVYLDEDGQIHRVMYDHDDEVLMHTSGPTGYCSENVHYIPNKRLYPESCDFEFCQLLTKTGERLPFTTFDAAYDERRRAANYGFAGRTFAQLSSGVTPL
jgi:hypothetical protein